MENSIPAKLKSCRFSIFLQENYTRNRIALSRWSGPHETKSQCSAWSSLKCPPILAYAAVRCIGFMFRCFVPPVSVNRLGFPRHLQLSPGWSNAIHPGSQQTQCPLGIEVKGSTLQSCRKSWRFLFIEEKKITGLRGSLEKSTCSCLSMLGFIHSNLYGPF